MIEYILPFLENCFKFAAFMRTNEIRESTKWRAYASIKMPLGEKQDPDFRQFPRLPWRQGIKFADTDSYKSVY